jgi:hypothetical protein
MPYITQNYRDELDALIDAFADKVNEIHARNPEQTRDGLLNYSVTRILNKTFPDARYHDYNEIIGFLECCKLEYYARKVAPYEILKATQNGEVQTFNKGDVKGY